MHFKKLADVLDFHFHQLTEKGRNTVPCFLGAPGVGKTQKIQQYAQDRGYGITELLGSTLSPTDMVAFMPDQETHMLSPFFSMQVPWEERVGDQRWIWFLDEITNTHVEVNKTIQKLINERELMGKKLGPNVLIVCAGNRHTDKAASHQLSSAMSNRLSFYEWHYDNEEFIDFLTERYETPELCAFIQFRPLTEDHFKQAISGKHESFVSWPNPRSVERLAGRYEYCKEQGRSLSADDASGDVGKGFATEFSGFLRIMTELPKIEMLRTDPEKVKVPDQIDRQYAMVALMIQSVDTKCLENFRKYLEKFDVALQVLFLKFMKKKDLHNHKVVRDWLTKPAIQSAII